jgi:protease IV
MKRFVRSIGRLFSLLWRIFSFCRELAGNLIFLVLVILILAIFFYDRKKEVPDGAALFLSIKGDIVEEKAETIFSSRLFGEPVREEMLLQDIIDVVDYAGDDDRIKALLLDTRDLGHAGISKLADIADALNRFQTSGKKIIAYGDYYSQQEYYLAAYADSLYLHPMGGVMLTGFGVYQNFFRSALEKLLIQFHAFRVGTYKSALEPFLRDDMSEYAKEANLAWLNVLWRTYIENVANLRRLTPNRIDDYVNNIAEHLARAKGDAAQLALDYGLVDGLKTRDEVEEELIRLVGKDSEGQTFKQIQFNEYLAVVQPKRFETHPDHAKVGVVVAKGIILDGDQPAGKIGGDNLADLIRQARQDDEISALVLRIDSPGGSALASETIRREIELTSESGKPVVVSMSSVAASGGYWIASAGDEIWAAPTTITGSIGIYGALATFEKSLDYLGIHNDGVGTTRLADAFNPARPLNPIVADSMDQMIRHGYQQFIDRVAKGRNLTPDQVEKIAQGRVWAGKTALELGLVDKFGNLQDATRSAAKMAGLTDYDVVYIERPLSPREKLIKELNRFLTTVFNKGWRGKADPLVRIYLDMGSEIRQILELSDPRGIYAHCLICSVE